MSDGRVALPWSQTYSKPAWSYHIGEQGDVFFVEPSHKISLHKKNPSQTGICHGSENRTIKNLGSKPNIDFISVDSQSNESSNCSLSLDSIKSQNSNSNRKDIFLLPKLCDEKDDISDVELFEKLFGIVLCSYNLKLPKTNSVKNKPQALNDRKLIVQKVVIGSQAQRTQNIHKGDILISIDDKKVSWNTLRTVLLYAKKQVPLKLTFQTPVVVGSPSSETKSGIKSPFCENLMLSSSGEDLDSLMSSLDAHKCKLLCLSLETIQCDLDFGQDIIYEFPFQSNKLTEVRGIFITLNQLLEDIVWSETKCSTISYENLTINVAYHREKNNILFLLMPSELCPQFVLISILNNLIKTLVVLFGNAFKPFCVSQNHLQLNQILTLLFHQLLPILNGKSSINMFSITNCHSEARWFFLEEEIKLMLDELIGDFESADFAYFEDLILPRRSYIVKGCCILYKGYMVCNHLPVNELLDVWSVLRVLGLVQFSQDHSYNELIIWHKVFLSQSNCPTPGYCTEKNNHSLLIVGQKQCLMCSILISDSSEDKPNPPDPQLIDQALLTLKQIETEGILECCDKRFSSPADISLGNPEIFVMSLDGIRSSKLFPTSEDGYLTGRIDEFLAHQGSQRSYGSNDSCASGNSTEKGKFPSLNGLFDMSGLTQSLSSVSKADQHNYNRCVKDVNSVLFHYVCIDRLEGIFMDKTEHCNRGTLCKQVIDNFNRCSLQIHAFFQETKQKMNRKKASSRKSSKASGYIREHGVLFNCFLQSPGNNKISGMLTYWVVGRMFAEPIEKEIYVCYHESIKQNLVELAYQTCFSLIA